MKPTRDLRSTKKVKMTKLLFCKKSLNIYITVIAVVILGLMSFKVSPEMKERIVTLEKSVQAWADAAANAIHGRRKAEKKVKYLEHENAVLRAAPAREVHTKEIIEKEKKVEVKIKLTAEDSLNIYQDVLQKYIHGTIKPIQKR
jgi:hypothetical protein